MKSVEVVLVKEWMGHPKGTVLSLYEWKANDMIAMGTAELNLKKESVSEETTEVGTAVDKQLVDVDNKMVKSPDKAKGFSLSLGRRK